ncbi:MAG: hypothetical protein ABI895_31290 [Deltaproteobacteria bacterium]
MKWLGVPCCAALALGSRLAAADLPAAVHIWYRSSQGCPDGDAFVRRLSELGRTAQLAQVGDAVDFLVSVSSGPEGSSGRLERQTQAGQLAIREMRAAGCEQITEGLALSLDLAIDPRPAYEATSERSSALRLGASGTLATGFSPAPLPGAALFVELAAQPAGASGRLEARVARGSGEGRAEVEVEVSVLLARLEGCPVTGSLGPWRFQPCAAVDVGRVWASSSHRVGRSDAGVWASASVLGRAVWQLEPRWALGVQAGAALPFVHYDLGPAEGSPVFRTHTVGFELGLGVAWQLP